MYPCAPVKIYKEHLAYNGDCFSLSQSLFFSLHLSLFSQLSSVAIMTVSCIFGQCSHAATACTQWAWLVGSEVCTLRELRDSHRFWCLAALKSLQKKIII